MTHAPRSIPLFVALAALIAVGCGDDAQDVSWHADHHQADAGPDDAHAADSSATPDTGSGLDSSINEAGLTDSSTPDASEGPLGFIGSPCQVNTDCAYDQAVCLKTDFPGGTCSLACDKICPDRDGFPTTFCVDSSPLPSEAKSLGAGACLSRCDYGLFPSTGCRSGYGCVPSARANEPSTKKYACVPGQSSQPSECQQKLAAAGVTFEPTIVPDAHPSGEPSLTCHVEDPIYVHSPIHGVVLKYGDKETPRVLMSCEGATSLVKTVDDVKQHGVVSITHMGTYNCRVIAGTNHLSQHASGNAIDFAGFKLSDGNYYTVLDDWEKDNPTPQSAGGKFLYAAAHRWYDDWIWNIILTPNYNTAHRNHFHVDMTAGKHTLRNQRPHVLMVAPYDD